MRGLVALLAVGAVLLVAPGETAGQPAPPPPGPGAAAGQPRLPPPRDPALRRPLRPMKVGPGAGMRRPAHGARPVTGRPGRPHAPAAARGAHGAAHGGGHPVHVNWYLASPKPGQNQPFLAALFNFIVLGLLLGRFGYPPIREFVKERHEKIGKDLGDAQRLRAEAEARLKEYEGKIANLDQEIAALLQQIRAEGEAERARMIAAAEEQAQRLRRDAQDAIAQDMKRARHEIEREAVTSAIAVAERILRERVTDADQRTFVEHYLVSLSTEAPGAGPIAPGRGAA